MPGYLQLAVGGGAVARQRALNPTVGFGHLLAQSAVRCNTAENYQSQWLLFSAFCQEVFVPSITAPPDLLSVELVSALGGLMAGQMAETVLIGFLGWLTMMKKPVDPTSGLVANWYKASSIKKYVQNVRRTMEVRCGIQFGGGLVPSLVTLPRALRGLIAHRNEGTLPRLVVAPQHLLAMCEAEGVVLRARHGRGPEVSFKRNDLMAGCRITPVLVFWT